MRVNEHTHTCTQSSDNPNAVFIIHSPLIASFVYLSFTPLLLSASLSLSRQTRTLQVMAFSVKSHFNGSLGGSRIKKKKQRKGAEEPTLTTVQAQVLDNAEF